jgi:hypothetical protein
LSRVVRGTEFRLELPHGWVDESSHSFKAPNVEVAIGRYAPRAETSKRLAEALERFRLSVANYELLERSPRERPTPGAELVAHRIRAGFEVFEISVFWPIDSLTWVFRARSLLTAEDECWAAANGFMETYHATRTEG